MSGPSPRPIDSPSAPSETAPLARVPVLLASAQEGDRSAVTDLLRGTRYVVVKAANSREAGKILNHIVFPIILYDAASDATEWHLGLKKMISAWRVPSVLLLANRYDAELAGDSLRRGAFDILVRPLRATDVMPALEFGYLQWKLRLGRTARPATGHDRKPLD